MDKNINLFFDLIVLLGKYKFECSVFLPHQLSTHSRNTQKFLLLVEAIKYRILKFGTRCCFFFSSNTHYTQHPHTQIQTQTRRILHSHNHKQSASRKIRASHKLPSSQSSVRLFRFSVYIYTLLFRLSACVKCALLHNWNRRNRHWTNERTNGAGIWIFECVNLVASKSFNRSDVFSWISIK